ncbi:hypothetical protein ILUMI_23251 [Ignelater luminosus]|uniref:Uncharacterized protein n=1 Tax=Ignelater luminosus TaxID=2038154 RepID=A0A8K0G1T4_IGNLU|nr:hypothetical protein ILUMI_23251 [Ignelater luminosus]
MFSTSSSADTPEVVVGREPYRVDCLYKCNKTPVEIFNLLKQLEITKKFLYRTLNRYNEMSSVNDRPRSGRPRETRTKEMKIPPRTT